VVVKPAALPVSPGRALFTTAALLCTVLLLSGCGTLLNISPERAAVQEVLNDRARDFQVDPDSIEVLQTAELGENVFVLVLYEGNRLPGQRDSCLYVYETQRFPLGWRIRSGGGSCGPADDPGEPIQLGSGSSLRDGRGEFSSTSHVHGRVNDEAIVAVEITWDDGESQRVEVINSTILLVRSGQHSWTLAEGFNAQDEVVFSQSQPLPAIR